MNTHEPSWALKSPYDPSWALMGVMTWQHVYKRVLMGTVEVILKSALACLWTLMIQFDMAPCAWVPMTDNDCSLSSWPENSATRFFGSRPRPRLYFQESQWRDKTETFFLLSLNIETRPRLFFLSLNVEMRLRLFSSESQFWDETETVSESQYRDKTETLYKTWLLSFYVKRSLHPTPFSLI